MHAGINRYFVLTANRVGQEAELHFTGASQVAGPDLDVLARGSEDGAEVVSCEVDPQRARDKQVTPRNHVLEDRRPELYGGLGLDP